MSSTGGGKTTTLRVLRDYLKDEYIVASLDFQELGTKEFEDASTFSRAFAKVLMRAFKISGSGESGELLEPLAVFAGKHDSSLDDLFEYLSSLCENSPRPVVLMIDEVDSAGNNQVFIEFLALLRKYYLNRDEPIINGTGNYYIEAQTRDERRTDVIVDYLGEQFIVELKIWRGGEYNERGEEQLTEYLEYYRRDKGYMLSFHFNKNKATGVKEIKVGNKTIVGAVV